MKDDHTFLELVLACLLAVLIGAGLGMLWFAPYWGEALVIERLGSQNK